MAFDFRAVVMFVTAAALAGVSGCHAGHPSPEQIKQVNQFVGDRTAINWNVARLFDPARQMPPDPVGALTLQDATGRALAHNLSLTASAENLSIAHAQLVQAGLLPNPVLGQSSGLLYPLSPTGGHPSVDGNITEAINSILAVPNKVAIARLQEVQANIDVATQAYLLAQQVDGKYQEMVSLLRRKKLALRIQDLYARAVSAAEARRKVGIISTPELNRARLGYQDSRRQVQHLATQYLRASREMNWMMGYSTAPAWHVPAAVIDDVGTVPSLPNANRLERLGLRYRLDLLRADFDRKVGRKSIQLAKLGLIPQINFGFEVQRDSSHNVVGGPYLPSITLPIFDPGLVGLELAKAQARKADKTFAALNGQVRQDVRTAFDNWRIAADDVRFFRTSLIPQQEENVRLMEISFRLGNDDLDTLLNVYQSYVSQLQAFEDAIQAYHDTGVALQQAVGSTWERILDHTPLPPASQPATTRPASLPVLTLPAPGPTTSSATTEQLP